MAEEGRVGDQGKEGGQEGKESPLGWLFHKYGMVVVYLLSIRSSEEWRTDADCDLAVLCSRADCTSKEAIRLGLKREVEQLLAPLKVGIIFLSEAPLEVKFEVISRGRLIYVGDQHLRQQFEDCVLEEYMAREGRNCLPELF